MKSNVIDHMKGNAVFLVFALLIYLTQFLTVPQVRYDEGWESIVSNNFLNTGELSMPQLSKEMGLAHYYFLHPPLYNLTLAYWYKLVGVGLFQGRALSFIFVGLSLLLLLSVISRTHHKKFIFVFMSLLILNPAFFILSRTIRPEGMLLFFFALSIFLFYSRWDLYLKLVGLGIIAGLALLTHIPGIVVYLAINLYLVRKLRFRETFKDDISHIVLFNFFFFVVLTPYLFYVYSHFSHFLEQAHRMYSGPSDISRYLTNPFNKQFLLHPFLIFTTIPFAVAVILSVRRVEYLKKKDLNIIYYFIFGYLLFIFFYLNKNRYNFFAMVPFFVYVMTDLLLKIRGRYLKYMILFLSGLNVVILGGLFFINMEFDSNDYRKFIVSNIPPHVRVLCRQEDFFIMHRRNLYFLYDLHLSSGAPLTEFIKTNNIQYLILNESMLSRLDIKQKHEIVAKTFIRYYKVSDENNCFLYIIRIIW